MENQKILRINQLSKLAKERELTLSEQEERATLRREYIDSVKANLEAQLKNITVIDKE